MDDPELIRNLTRTAPEEEAEEQQRWERWERLTDGDLSPEEEAELRAEDPIAFEAFRPLDSDFRARMVDMIEPLIEPPLWVKWLRAVRQEMRRWRTLLKPDRRASWWDRSSNGASPAIASTFPAFASTRPWWRMGYIGSGVAATALFLAMIYWPHSHKPESTMVALDFDVERAVPGKTEIRGDEGAAALTAGETFDTSATPAKAHSVEVDSVVVPRCYVKPKATPTHIHTVDCAASDVKGNGSMKIHGSLPKDLPAGPATLLIVFAASGNQPSADIVKQLPTDHPTKEKNFFAGPQPIEILTP